MKIDFYKGESGVIDLQLDTPLAGLNLVVGIERLGKIYRVYSTADDTITKESDTHYTIALDAETTTQMQGVYSLQFKVYNTENGEVDIECPELQINVLNNQIHDKQ